MTLSPFAFLVAILATYRLARLVSMDSLTEPLRAWIDPGSPDGFRGWLTALVDCGFCSSVWLAAGVTAVTLGADHALAGVGPVEFLLTFLGVAGGASILVAVDSALTE